MAAPALLSALLLSASTAVLGAHRPAIQDTLTVSEPHGRGLASVPNPIRHLFAGAISGAVTVTLLSPVEVVRIQLMTEKGKGLRAALRSLESGWFKGNSADVLSAAPRIGITMASFTMYQQLLRRAIAVRSEESTPACSPGWTIFLAGAMAGATATVVTYPLDLVRTRMAVAEEATSIMRCMRGLAQAGGPAALYAGVAATLAGVLPFSSIKLASYELLRRHATSDCDCSTASLPAVKSVSFGALAGVTAATSCFPLELVRRRQMLGQFVRVSPFAAVLAIARTEGIAALFAGSGVNTVKVALANGMGFMLWETAKDLLEVDGRTSPLAAGRSSVALVSDKADAS